MSAVAVAHSVRARKAYISPRQLCWLCDSTYSCRPTSHPASINYLTVFSLSSPGIKILPSQCMLLSPFPSPSLPLQHTFRWSGCVAVVLFIRDMAETSGLLCTPGVAPAHVFSLAYESTVVDLFHLSAIKIHRATESMS